MKKLIPALIIIAVIGSAIMLLLPGDQKKIEDSLEKGSKAMRDERISKIMSLVSHEYSDTYGLSYGALQRIFARTFFQIDSIEVTYTIRSLAINKKSATVIIDITVTGSPAGNKQFIIGKPNSPELLTLTYTKGWLKWTVIESHWQNHRFLEDAFGIPLPSHL